MRFSSAVPGFTVVTAFALVVTTSGFAQQAGDSTPVATNQPAASQPAGVPPPAAPAKRSAAELEKLAEPIALYPDPLVATILPASVYPLEIVQAARLLADTNNLAKLDEQPWDDNVKAVARVPDALKQLNDNLSWTIALGDAFLAQDKDLMDAIQALRLKAQQAGTLQTTSQQVVFVTNTVVETAVEQQVVIVTNTIVQIVPSDPEIIYVPEYDPAIVYYPPPAYVYNPYDPLITFGAGVAIGVIIANNCDWYHGGCYHNDVNINIDRNVNRGARPTPYSGTGKKWQPDQNRLRTSGSGTAATRSAEARGWDSGARPSTGAVGARPSTGTGGARPSTGTAGPRPTTRAGTPSSRPSSGTGPQVIRGTPSSPPAPANRPSAPANTPRPSPTPSNASRPAPSTGSGNAFSGVGNGSTARASSNRGSASRAGGGGRGGGGRR